MNIDRINTNSQIINVNNNVYNSVNNSSKINNNQLKADSIEFSTKNNLRKKSRNIFDRAAASFYKFIGLFPKKNKFSQHIRFEEAKTFDEAIEFGRQTFGIKKYKGFEKEDLDVINWVNEGLVHVNNAAKGNISVPNEIEYKELDNSLSAAIGGFNSFIINKKEVIAEKKLVADIFGENLNCKEAKRLAGHLMEAFSPSYMSVFADISHEMGHLQHFANIEDLFGSLVFLADSKLKNIKIFRKLFVEKEAEEMQKVFDNSKDTAGKVSEYAKTSPLEFVAECYSKMCDGIKLDDDVMKLYVQLGGVLL